MNSFDNTTLLPCPFCGDKTADMHVREFTPEENMSFKRWNTVFCPSCFVECFGSETESEAVEQWNTRIR